MPQERADIADIDALGASWFYDWDVGSWANTDRRYVPMSYSGNDPNLPENYSGYLLVFNEPENAGQANLTPQQAAQRVANLHALYPQARLIVGGVSVVWPWSRAWLTAFRSLLTVPIAGWHYHAYIERLGNMAVTLTDCQDWLTWAHETQGGGEFWLTEFADTVDGTHGAEYMTWVMAQPWITRCAWFATRCGPEDAWYPPDWSHNPRLVDNAGLLTVTGAMYRAIGGA